MRPQDLLVPTLSGLFCPLGGFHVDPLRAVDKAFITHAHADRARAGHGAVAATRETLDLMRLRLGPRFADAEQAVTYGQPQQAGEVTVTFYPAGHVLGSAQILVEHSGLRVVVAGDYKDAGDPTCTPFALVTCDLFVTEATFGLPVFRHGNPQGEIGKLLRSLQDNADRTHLVGAYSLGKAQRMIALLRQAGYDEPIYLHSALEATTRYFVARTELGNVQPVRTAAKVELPGRVTLCPPAALKETWTRRFLNPLTVLASGWMRVPTRARQRGVDLPLVISDHADWDGLRATIAATGAAEIWLTHGAADALLDWCRTRGLVARSLNIVGYGEEDETAGDENAPRLSGR